MRLGPLASAFLLVWGLRAEPPELRALYPIGAALDTTNHISLAGKFDPWPPKIWCEPPGLAFQFETNKNKLTIVIPRDAKPGARLIRVYNEDGASDARFFVVGNGRELVEKEPNNHLAEAQEPGSLPCVINARFDKNDDADCYKIALRAGDWIDASVEAYTLMSKVDAVLRLVTTNGVTLAWNHDYATFDPHLWWRAPSDQTVILQAFGFAYPANSEIRLTGGEEAFYRLHLANSPPPRWQDQNETNTTALPFRKLGTLAQPHQEDRYIFSMEKDRFVEARIRAAVLGSPLDAWLKIEDLAGKQLAQNDDHDGTRDPQLEWKAPAATNYVLVVGSTLNRGQTNYHYELNARLLLPDFSATWSANGLILKAGETNTLKFDFKRLREHTNDVTALLQGLPEGVNCQPTNLPAKSGEVSWSIVAGTNAAAFQGPIRLTLVDSQTKIEKNALIELTTRGENNGVPNGYNTLAIERYDAFWLTVKTQAVKEMTTNSASK